MQPPYPGGEAHQAAHGRLQALQGALAAIVGTSFNDHLRRRTLDGQYVQVLRTHLSAHHVYDGPLFWFTVANLESIHAEQHSLDTAPPRPTE